MACDVCYIMSLSSNLPLLVHKRPPTLCCFDWVRGSCKQEAAQLKDDVAIQKYLKKVKRIQVCKHQHRKIKAGKIFKMGRNRFWYHCKIELK